MPTLEDERTRTNPPANELVIRHVTGDGPQQRAPRRRPSLLLTLAVGALAVAVFLAAGVLTGILDMAYAKAGGDDGMITTLLVEPSYHLPFNRTTFGFLGMGIGGSYIKGPGLGFAVAPRVGANMMVGRSGILTPSLAWQYTTHDSMDIGGGTAPGETSTQVLVVTSALRAQIGYTVMW